jgi:hypothetical protein
MYTNRLTKIYCDIRGIMANCKLIIPVYAGDTYPWRHFTWSIWTPAYKINRPNSIMNRVAWRPIFGNENCMEGANYNTRKAHQ